MKLLNLVIVSLFVVSSVAYSDIVSDLKAKKNNSQKQGITYSVILNGHQEEKVIITEKGNNKLVKQKLNGNEMEKLHLPRCDDTIRTRNDRIKKIFC